jgi:cobalt-zinc-cadmium efflux system protein
MAMYAYVVRVTGHHDHAPSPASRRGPLVVALGVLVAYMAAEVVIGLLAGSLALLSDAAHMLTDAASLVLVLITMRLAERPPRGGYTYGLRRTEILSAQANGLTLLLLGAWLGYEAISRLVHPRAVAGGWVLGTALAGVAVNLVATLLVARAGRRSLNVEGAFQHLLTDLYAFLATAVAGLVILLTGQTRLDPLATLVVVALMARAGVRLLGDSGRILLEAAPAGIRPGELGGRLAAVDGVREVHDLHVWEITSGQPALSAHVLVAPDSDCHGVRLALEQLLHDEYRIDHTTLQVDHARTDLLQIQPRPTRYGVGHDDA